MERMGQNQSDGVNVSSRRLPRQTASCFVLRVAVDAQNCTGRLYQVRARPKNNILNKLNQLLRQHRLIAARLVACLKCVISDLTIQRLQYEFIC